MPKSRLARRATAWCSAPEACDASRRRTALAGDICNKCIKAFVVETCGFNGWAIERVPAGSFRNISNGISIRQDIHAIKEGLAEDIASRSGWGPKDGRLDWKVALSGRRVGSGALDLAGREKAGHRHLQAMAQDLQEGQLQSGDLRAWVERFIAVLRDEDSGICFRDLHGFNSTGSQVSLLFPAAPGAEHSSAPHRHFFSCASDPISTSYKQFAFPPASTASLAAGAPDDHGSLELWRTWRTSALAGRPLPSYARELLRAWEDETLAAVAAHPSTGAPAAPDLRAACQRELTLLAGSMEAQ
mmetsp:Transcript_102656/g.328988  ORF Transcript_102656/g.328988 Transcript_102656/m.328988 type:complete len:301 (+) Transcript_102656:3686-4588(+)